MSCYVRFCAFSPSLTASIGPLGTCTSVLINSSLSAGKVFINKDLLSLAQTTLLPMLAFIIALVSFLAFALLTSTSQSSTPSCVVLVNEMYLSSGKKEKLAICGFAGNPVTWVLFLFFKEPSSKLL